MDGPPAVQIEEPAILIRISRLWDPGLSDDELYDATRGHWKVGRVARKRSWPLPSPMGLFGKCSRSDHDNVWTDLGLPGRWTSPVPS